jgi:polyisoprenoid-binding protein YceI
MKKSFWMIGAVVMLFNSCGSDDTTAEVEEVNEVKECYYTYNSANSKLTWTAYKFTEKTPVSGTFNEINIEGAEVLNDALQVIEGLSFSIPVASVNTQNPERDEKIKQSFFGVLTNTSLLTGKVISMKDGKAELLLNLNDVESVVVGSYTLDGGDFRFTATLDLTQFDALNGVESLNKVCEDLHIGADGVSKLWEVVDLSFETKLNMNCN